MDIALDSAAGARWGRPLGMGPLTAFGGAAQDWIAESRVRIRRLRLPALEPAWPVDPGSGRRAHPETPAIKIAAPRTAQRSVDRADQASGAAEDLPSAAMPAGARPPRFAGGPDEVHKGSLVHREPRRHRRRPPDRRNPGRPGRGQRGVPDLLGRSLGTTRCGTGGGRGRGCRVGTRFRGRTSPIRTAHSRRCRYRHRGR